MTEEEIFLHAAALPRDERSAYLDGLCSHDAELRGRVEELLVAQDDDAFMLRVADRTFSAEVEEAAARLKPEESGERIGNYKLLQQIGEGGFGSVWMAEQERPVRRRVALKIIKLGMDTKEVIARFEQERQALAMMDHPNIAKVLDAGATPFGRPYFVMELVHGVKITEYCDHALLSTKDRLKLFIAVCQAVQHAHQKGIIHRDLKPSNILVTLHDGVPVPKVIDFGVAKATQQQRLTDLTLFTQFEQMIGTPLYMAPEQAELSGLDIDTRSDIYSLGVLLYELLTGRTPFDPEALMKAGFDEMRRVIREEEPQKPSTFLSTMAVERRTDVARHRQSEGAKLVGAIRGDLDWIVMKALEKDRSRRYETATGLARDVERHLASEPVEARPPDVSYRFRRFLKRNRVTVAAGASVTLALAVGVVTTSWKALEAQAEANRANGALSELRAAAPAFLEQARTLVSQHNFSEAIRKIDYAAALCPDEIKYTVAKADLLQAQLRFAEAIPLYRAATKNPEKNERAGLNLKLCEELNREQTGGRKLSRTSLERLLAIMSEENRSAAEMLTVGRLLGEEKSILLSYWMERLKNLAIPPERTLKDRLTYTNELTLDLSDTPIADISVLAGMPLAHLDLANCKNVVDITVLKGTALRRLNLRGTSVEDLAAIGEIPTLTELSIASTKVPKIESLKGLRNLQYLDLRDTSITDLTPLRGHALKELLLSGTKVADLSALKGMPLEVFVCKSIFAKDFAPLAGAPITTLDIEATLVNDLTFVRGMPLKVLALNGCKEARGFEVINQLTALEVLLLPETATELPTSELRAIESLKAHPTLKQIQMGPVMRGMSLTGATAKEEFWAQYTRDMEFREGFAKVAAGNGFFKKESDGAWVVSFRGLKVSDLTSLKGLPISTLDLNFTQVSDLSPLEGMPLRNLALGSAPVSDITPLFKCPLRGLSLKGCAKGIDVGSLAKIATLRELLLPDEPKNLEALRSLEKLERLSYDVDEQTGQIAQTASEFWAGKRPAEFEVIALAREKDFKGARNILAAKLETSKMTARLKGLENSDWTTTDSWLALGLMIIAGGDHAGYQRFCREMVGFFEGVKNRDVELKTLQVCLAAPDCGVPMEKLKELLKRYRESDVHPTNREWGLMMEALWEYRVGDNDRALEISRSVGIVHGPMITSKLISALASARKGDLLGARSRLQEQDVVMSRNWKAGGGSWYHWLFADLLGKEAEVLLQSAEDQERP